MNVFKNFTSPKVLDEIDVYTFLDYIENPEAEILSKIEEARNIYELDTEVYDNIKSTLPCYTLNFTFNNWKNNENIKETTGFIYLDVDDETEIEKSNPYIFATWLSLSGNGRGILVKVDDLTLQNFKNTYISIAKTLNIKVDEAAAKASQYTVQSFDKDVYLNNDSLTWKVENNTFKDSPITPLIKNKRKGNPKMGENQKLRFSNIDEYDFKGNDFIYFEDEKELIAQVKVPYRIYDGGRNNIISAIAYQIKALHPEIEDDTLTTIIFSINEKRCVPKLRDNEVMEIVNKVLRLKDVEPILNVEKRFLFDPKKMLSHKQKMKMIAPIMGKRKSDKTIQKLKNIIEGWNVEKQGNITQEKLQKVSKFNIKTIERYYKLFKTQIIEIKENYKLLKSTNIESAI